MERIPLTTRLTVLLVILSLTMIGTATYVLCVDVLAFDWSAAADATAAQGTTTVVLP